MSDLKLYNVASAEVVELTAAAARLERDLQKVIESNMEVMFGVRLLASEYTTSALHGGRMDSIGLDENGSPVIFEYKRNVSESVINQGLFYLDWLLDHQGDFRILVIEKLGQQAAETVDFTNPRLICIANDFTRYDEHAIRQMGRSIELVRYQQFEGNLLALERVAATLNAATNVPAKTPSSDGKRPGARYVTAAEDLQKAPQVIQELHERLCREIEAMGDDITSKWTKVYLAFRRLKNFASIEVYSQAQKILVFVKADIESVELEQGFSRDVTNIGHTGTGNLELTISSVTSLERALPFIQQSYEAN